jgi:ssDNA-binding Zn-finger/Zn-ribbon topoisomerase 1
MPESIVPVEVVCPKCQHTEIVYIPKEQIPKCPDCKTQMVLRELLREGKSY